MRISRSLALALLGLLALACAAGGYVLAHVTQGENEVRVVVRPHEDGRIEVALQQRTEGNWSEPLKPERRFLSPERIEQQAGRWLQSSPLLLEAQPEPEPLRIGFIGSYTGTPAPSGPDRQTGAELAVAHLNAAGGVNGRPVELVVGDTGSELEVVLAEARRLVEEEGVHAIVGPDRSSFTLAVVEAVTRPAGIPTSLAFGDFAPADHRRRRRLPLPQHHLRRCARAGAGGAGAGRGLHERRRDLLRRRLWTRVGRVVCGRLERSEAGSWRRRQSTASRTPI